MGEWALGLLPGIDAALEVAGAGKACVLRRLHRHRRAFAERAVEQQPLAGRPGEFVQRAARTDVFLQARIGHMQ